MTVSQYLDFSDVISGDINDCELIIQCNEMCQHLEDRHNLGKGVFRCPVQSVSKSCLDKRSSPSARQTRGV